MYRVLLERGAEKDLSWLSSEIHDRVVTAIQALATNPRPPGCRKLATTGVSALVTTAFFMKLLIRFESCGLTGCAIAAKSIVRAL
jgi:hypothetical protein